MKDTVSGLRAIEIMSSSKLWMTCTTLVHRLIVRDAMNNSELWMT